MSEDYGQPPATGIGDRRAARNFTEPVTA